MGDKDRFRSAGTFGAPSKIYIAFSPANHKSKEYARILSEGIVSLRASGELKEILGKYGLDDWK
jgi:polar amino acid transport system substrate-binding protein